MTYEITTIPASDQTYTYGRSGKSVDFIVVHYTGADGSAINNGIYFSGGNRYASAHYFIDSTDIVASVPEDSTAWHAGNFDINERSIGIEVCSSGEDFTSEEIERLTWLVGILMERYGVSPHHVIRHFDVADYAYTGGIVDPYKLCPAPYIDQDKWEWLHSIIVSDLEYSGKIAEDGFWGTETTKALQKLFGTPVDGIVSHQWPSCEEPAFSSGWEYDRTGIGSIIITEIQKAVGVEHADGLIGPHTIKKLQEHMETPVDGVLSGPSLCVKEMQRRINEGRF